MKSILSKFSAAAATAIVCSGAAMAQNPIYQIPGLGAYYGTMEFNQLMQLRQLQQLQMIQQIQQQGQQQRQEQQRQAQQRQAQIEELQATARKSVADVSKGFCVSIFVNDASASEALSRKGATIGKLCGCVEQEMFAMLTLDLSGQILLAGSDSGGDNEKFLSSPAGKEWLNRYAAASNACIKQMVRNE